MHYSGSLLPIDLPIFTVKKSPYTPQSPTTIPSWTTFSEVSEIFLSPKRLFFGQVKECSRGILDLYYHIPNGLQPFPDLWNNFQKNAPVKKKREWYCTADHFDHCFDLFAVLMGGRHERTDERKEWKWVCSSLKLESELYGLLDCLTDQLSFWLSNMVFYCLFWKSFISTVVVITGRVMSLLRPSRRETWGIIMEGWE